MRGLRGTFEMYSPLVRRGDIVAFHDIVPGSPENVGGTPRSWNKIKSKYNYFSLDCKRLEPGLGWHRRSISMNVEGQTSKSSGGVLL